MKNPLEPSSFVKDRLTVYRPDPVLVRSEGNNVFIFLKPDQPHFYYDFEVTAGQSAVSWICHMAEKSWVTKEHLRQFAGLVINMAVEKD